MPSKNSYLGNNDYKIFIYLYKVYSNSMMRGKFIDSNSYIFKLKEKQLMN